MPIAAVATGFPSGQYSLKSRLEEIRFAIDSGASEVDIVLNRTLVLEGRWRGEPEVSGLLTPFVLPVRLVRRGLCNARNLWPTRSPKNHSGGGRTWLILEYLRGFHGLHDGWSGLY